MTVVKFDKEQLDILSEVGNMTVGKAATSLSDFVNKMVTITIPNTKVCTYAELKEEFNNSVVTTKINYKDGFVGTNLLMIEKKDAITFSRIIAQEKLGNGEMVTDWGELSESVLSEVFNIMVGNMSSGMSDILNRHIIIDTPIMFAEEELKKAEMEWKEDNLIVAIWFDLRIEADLNIRLVNIISIAQAKKMLSIIKGGEES